MMRMLMGALSCGALLAMTWACATSGPGKPLVHREVPETPQMLPGDIINTAGGEKVGYDAFIKDIASAAIIYAGESHTNPEDHNVQLRILEALYAENPSLTLAMEMFPREAQPVLDNWSRGALSEAEFLEQAHWKDVWGFPYRLYRPLMDFAREKHLRVLGINAPHPIVQRIARQGLASLTPDERSLIARTFYFDDPEHREYIRQQFDAHHPEVIKDFESFYEAQLTWEETMAETLADELRTSRGNEQILVLLGKGHMSYRFGVPQRARQRVEHLYKTVMPMPENLVTLPADPNIADYLWITEKWKHPHGQRGRLGVMIRSASSGKGLEVLGTVPGGPAEKAGIQKGDVIEAVNGISLEDPEAIHEAIGSGGSTLLIRLKRQDVEKEVTLTLPESVNKTPAQ
jgi:uncharacterized iron-regulated protein